ncbi:MAG: hypothetical protein HC767_07545 [Akkermansiaceae bacterium]|nr:hypothetical protein [Akkermansiaceae bacterium]
MGRRAEHGARHVLLVDTVAANHERDQLPCTSRRWQRTHQTAAPLVARLGIEPKVEPELREVFLGGLGRRRVPHRPWGDRLRRRGALTRRPAHRRRAARRQLALSGQHRGLRSQCRLPAGRGAG